MARKKKRSKVKLDKDYIEREVKRKKKSYTNGGMIFAIFSLGSLIGFIFADASVWGGAMIFFAILSLISFLYPYFIDEQALRDHIKRAEEVRGVQLHVLKQGKTKVRLSGKMKKLK